ncbi:MAG: ribosome silencing factor [Chloroflexi bacterium]|nr:ribosome silencing factor [Chloroflexota bacterium]
MSSDGGNILETTELARKIVDAALNRHASDILLLDIRDGCSFTDYFVICNGESERQLRAISDEIEDMLPKEGILSRRHQGNADSGWIILDLGDIVVHIFSPEQRKFYALEEMWEKAYTIVKIL